MRLSKLSKGFWRNTGFAIALVLTTIAIPTLYITHQRAFIGGDINDDFYLHVLNIADQFQVSPLSAVKTLFRTGSNTYNRYFTLPLLPFIWIFGKSYLIYTLSVAIVYLLPLNGMMGLLATLLLPRHTLSVFASAVLISTFMTPAWISIFMGYPDIGGTLLIAIAMWVIWHPVYKTWDWLLRCNGQVPLLGFFLGTAILFRRHFAYADISLLGAIATHTAIVFSKELRQTPQTAWKNLWAFAIRGGLLLLTILATLALFAWGFTHKAFTTDYLSLYQSWSRTTGETVEFYGALYGYGVWGIAVLGFCAGLVKRVVNPAIAIFIITYSVLSILMWCFRLRYSETYYAIHFIPFLVLGCTAFVWTVWLKLRYFQRWLIIVTFSFYLGLNIVVGLTPVGTFNHPLRSLFAAAYPPPVRQDYDEVIRLAEFLRQRTPNQEPVFVVHNSGFSLPVVEAAQVKPGNLNKKLNLLQGSVIDSVGFYPIMELVKAEYVVISTPFISWNVGQNETAKVVSDAFLEQWEIFQDFKRLPEQFFLQGGITVNLYQRIRPTSSERAVRTLYAMQARINKPLSAQLDWIMLSPSSNAIIRPDEQQGYFIRIKPSQEDQVYPLNQFLFLGKLNSNLIRLTGKVELRKKSCPAVTLQFSLINAQGQEIGKSQRIVTQKTVPFQMQFNQAGVAYIRLDLANPELVAEKSVCSIVLSQLTVQ